jgi:hypothetical protein
MLAKTVEHDLNQMCEHIDDLSDLLTYDRDKTAEITLEPPMPVLERIGLHAAATP